MEKPHARERHARGRSQPGRAFCRHALAFVTIDGNPGYIGPRMPRQLLGLGQFSCSLCWVLLAACGGQARSNSADESKAGATASNAGSGAVAGSAGTASGGDGASQAGSANAGSNAQAGTPGPGSNAHAGTANAGGASQAGTANAGGNAAGGAAGGDGASSGAAVIAACSSLCESLGDCAVDEGGFSPTCTSDCSKAIVAEDSDCTTRGIDLLSCLTSALHAGSHECSERFSLALQACDSKVHAYWGCGGTDNSSALCVHISRASSEGGTLDCMDDLKCLNTLINNLHCIGTTDGKSNCSCFANFHRTDTTVNESPLTVCKNRFAECMATSTVKP